MEFIKRHKKRLFVFLTILLIAIAGITGAKNYRPSVLGNSLGFIVVPVQKVVYDATQYVSAIFSKRRDVSELKTENEQLKQQVAALIDENKRLSLFEAENIELSKLLNINRKYPDYEKMGVQVISSTTSNWHNVFTIDKGSADGVLEDMFVIADGGLVGRIFEVNERYSKLMAIIDDRSAVHGQSRQTEDIGVVKGDTNLMQQGLCRMEAINLEAEISIGDEIITSVFSDIPAGISIGYVKEIAASADGLTKTAVIMPGVDFPNLNKAIILMGVKED